MNRFLAMILLGAVAIPARAAYSWGVLTPDNAGFSAEFPGEPEHSSAKKPDTVSDIWMVRSSDGLTLTMVGVTDYYAPIDAKRELALDEKNFLTQVKGTSMSSKKSSFRGPRGEKLPSSLFTFETGTGWSGKSRIIVDHDSTFQTVVMWKRMLEGSEVVTRFERSFKLVPRTKPPAPAPDAPKGQAGTVTPPTTNGEKVR